MFANPLALLALGLLALPVLIHMLARFKGPSVLFPTTKYLRASESDRLKLTKIERWPLLIIRLLACGLLALAISGPAPSGETTKSRAVLLLIDSSLGMNTEAAGEQARRRAREVVASLGADDVAAVAQFDDSIKLLCDFTSDRNSLEAGIAAYGPRYAAADFSAALEWSDKKLAARPHMKELVLISDLNAANVHSSKPVRLGGVHLRIVRIENVRRINARPGSITTRAAGDSVVVESTALLSEGGRTTITPLSFKIARHEGPADVIVNDSDAVLSAKVEGDLIVGAIITNRADEFDADDSRFFAAPVPREEKILLVESRLDASDQTTFIDKAIQSGFQFGRAVKSDSLPASADGFAAYSVAIAPVESLTGNGIDAAREFVRGGGSLILTVGMESDAVSAAERLNGMGVTPSHISLNTIAAAASLGLMPPLPPAHNYAAEVAPSINAENLPAFMSVRFRAAHSVHAPEGEVILRYSNDEPAAVRVSAGAGRVLILGFGLSDKESPFVRSPVYPTFIEWLTSRAAAGYGVGQFTIGHAPTSDLMRGLTRLTRLYSSNGPAQKVIADGRGALAEPGVYEAEYQSGKRFFALNSPPAGTLLEQATESQILERVAVADADAEGFNAAQAEEGSQLWRALAIGALVMSLIELAYGRMTSGG